MDEVPQPVPTIRASAQPTGKEPLTLGLRMPFKSRDRPKPVHALTETSQRRQIGVTIRNLGPFSRGTATLEARAANEFRTEFF